MKTRELTYERLKEKIHYDPETGKFTRTWPDHNRKVGRLDKDGYLAIAIDRVKHRAGRLAWLYMTGKHPDESMHVDHINRIRDDNRWENLRLLTPQDNRAHRVVTRKPPASGVTGVYWDGRKNKWVVQLFRNRKVHYGGYHSTIDAAAAAADELRTTLDQQSAA